MYRSRFRLLAGFAVLASTAFLVTKSDAKPDEVTAIAKGVWFREGDIKGHGHCNNIIIEMRDYLIVVDANFPSGARRALADARKVSSKPVKYVFDTHHHGDHAYGNAVWTEAGATTLAYKAVAEEMKRYEPKRWQEASAQREDVRGLKLATAQPPKQTFEKSPHVLDDGARRVEFHHFGWAHTRGDGFVYLPKEKILCTGDAVTNGPYNYTGDGHIGNWPDVIRGARKLGVERVLPGHGTPGGKEVLDGELAFMTELHGSVKQAIAQGKKLGDLVKMDGDKAVSTTVKLSPAVQNWVGQGLPNQVRDAYEEITQGKPHGEILGGK
ncbi:MAG: MBL fold metallo-hydrolase [Bryobacteraceae bacterium]